MSFIVKSYMSTNNVWVVDVSQHCNTNAFLFLEELPDGSMRPLQPVESTHNISYFSQGSEDIIGNNSVIHSSVEGEVVVLPQSSTMKFTRSVSTTQTYDNRLSEYSMESIQYGKSSCRGSYHYVLRQRGNLWNSQLHEAISTKWSLQTVVQFSQRFEDDYRGVLAETKIFSVNFPPITRSDIKWSDRYRAYHLDIRATAITRNEGGIITRTSSEPMNITPLGKLTFVDPTRLLSYIKVPVTGGPDAPDDLLIRLSKKIGALRVNNLANIAQLRRLEELLPPSIKHRSKVFKSAAEFILWFKYSYSTTDMDIEEIMKYYLRREESTNKSKGYSHRATVSIAADSHTNDRFTFYLGSYQQSILQKFGLQLNLANTWDLIPFSFVVDWFSKIGDMLESLDAVDEWVQVPLVCYVSSRKSYRPYTLPAEISEAFSDLSIKFYSRQVSKTLPMTLVSPSLNLPQGQLLSALSLIIANKKS